MKSNNFTFQGFLEACFGGDSSPPPPPPPKKNIGYSPPPPQMFSRLYVDSDLVLPADVPDSPPPPPQKKSENLQEALLSVHCTEEK